MSWRFSRYGQVVRPGTVRLEILESSASLEPLMDGLNWELARYDGSDWQEVSDGERLLQVRMHEQDAAALEASFTHLGGVYRLTCTASAVDADWNRVVFRADSRGLEPLYVELEGLNLHGANRLHACYLDPDSMPESLSWQVNLKEGIASAGAFNLRLVDIDGELTEALAPRTANRITRRLAADAGKSDVTLVLSSVTGLAGAGVIYLGHEAVRYGGISGVSLTDCVRGVLGTQAEAHELGAAVFLADPYTKGRFAWVKQPGVSGYAEDDTVLFAGIVERLRPSHENLACYDLQLVDPLGALTEPIGKRLAGAALSDELVIDGDMTIYGRRGNDTLYFRHRTHPVLPWQTHAVRLSPGAYLYGTESLGDARHVLTALKAALQDELPGLITNISLDEKRRVLFEVMVDDSFQLLTNDPLGPDRDSMLGSLGFEEKNSEIAVNASGVMTRPDSGLQAQALCGNFALQGGLGAQNRTIYLELDLLQSGGGADFTGGELVRIDDELIYYDAFVARTGSNAASNSLLSAIDDRSTVIVLDAAEDFPQDGAVVQIDEELIRYQRIEGTAILVGCQRGVWSSNAANHPADADVTLMERPCLVGCIRGVLGTSESAHDSGAEVQEIISSEQLSQPRPGQLVQHPGEPVAFIQRLLDRNQSGGRGGLRYGPLIDAPAFAQLQDHFGVQLAGGFRRIVLPDESYRDVISDICKSLGIYLVHTGRGIAPILPAPHLRHEAIAASFTHAGMLAPPKADWRDDLRINRVDVKLDVDAMTQEYATRIIVDDDQGRLSLDGDDSELQLESGCLRSGRMEGLRTGGDDWAYDLAWRQIRDYNRFLVTLNLAVPFDAGKGLAPLDPVLVSSTAIPNGSGTRGIEQASFVVTELDLDMAHAQVSLTLLERGSANYGGMAPALVITGWDATNLTLQLSAGAFWPASLEPAEFLGGADALRIKDSSLLSGGVYAISPIMTIAPDGVDTSGWESTQTLAITLASAPLSSPQAGDVLVCANWDEHLAASGLRDFVHLADGDDSLGSAQDEPFVYSY